MSTITIAKEAMIINLVSTITIFELQ